MSRVRSSMCAIHAVMSFTQLMYVVRFAKLVSCFTLASLERA